MIALELLPAQEAIDSFEAKGYIIGFDWRDVLAEEHAKAFTVAKMMRLDLLAVVRDHLDSAMQAGLSLREFQDRLRPTLEKEGWWGVQAMEDPVTGETKLARLGSPRRLEVIYDINMRVSYGAGRWARGERSADRLPLLLYRTMRDARVRPLHQKWDGVTLPRTDGWWDTHYPPNGWRCRCIAYPITRADAEALAERGLPVTYEAPPVRTAEWKNPRTGEVRQVPVGIDPGWDYNPGKSAQSHLAAVLAEKEAAWREAT